jgi:biopolymer transport protein TolR
MSMGGQTGVKSEINVTPLVDVMLVLLIIMMIVAPLLQQGVTVQLPKATNTTEKPETQGQTVVAITSDGRFYVNTVEVSKDRLQARIAEIFETSETRVVIIKADVDVEYAAVMDAMDQLRKSGIEDMGLITDPERGGTAFGSE